ncbi:MAG: T9SS C-terminal target domain-containing protein, partial [Bacteroidota bacterium]
GYLVYQLANAEVNPADLDDIGKARLIAQCDVRNEISNIINYSRDPDTEMIVPELMVDASNEGIRRSFRVTTDAFAQGNNRLVNHKTYYFMVIAYGYNNYQEYDVAQERGQDEAFLASRKGAIGAIPVIAAIPHDVKPENGGTTANASYGTGVFLTRIEG